MKPVEIHVKNFLSYKEEKLTFPNHANVICVTGFNGDGKSSLIVDAILCALFAEGRGESKLDAMIRDGEKEAMVSFAFEVNGKRYRVRRTIHKTTSRNQRLFEEWNGSAWTNPISADAEVKAALYRLLPYSYTTFIHTAFVLQGQTDRFLARKSAEERQETMREVLALIGYEERAEVAQELKRNASRDAEVRRGQAEHLRLGVAQRREEAEAAVRTFGATRDELARKAEPLRQAHELATIRVEALKLAQTQYRQAFAALRDARRAWRASLGRSDEVVQKVEAIRELAAQRQQLAAAAELYQAGVFAATTWETIKQRRAEVEREMELLRTRAQVEEQNLERQLKDAAHAQTSLQTAAERARGAAELVVRLKALAADWNTYTDLDDRRKRLAPELAEVRKNLEHIETEDGSCPFCLQELQGDSREQALARLRNRLAELEVMEAATSRELGEVKARVQAEMSALQFKERRHVDIALNEAEMAVDEGERALALQPGAVAKVGEVGNQIAEVQKRLASNLRPYEAELSTKPYDAAAHQAAQAQAEANRSSHDEYLRLDGELAGLPVLEERVKGLAELVAAQAEKRLGTVRQALDRRKAAMGYDQAVMHQKQAEEEHNKVVADLTEAKAKVAAAESILAGCAADEKRIDELTKEAAAYGRRATLLGVLEQAYRPEGVPALIIREAMPSLLQKANTLLERWTGGRIVIDERPDAGVPGRQRTRGNLNDLQFDIWDMDADSARPYALYSGGERFRVDMALRIALSQLLAERAGSPVQMLVIDEGFGTQDPDGLQKMIQIIHDLRKDFHSIIVISHIEEIKRMGYDRMIRIVKEDGISRIAEGA